MDELLQHCLQELAFDGDYGCNITRLRDFVHEFYSTRSSMHQTLDDAYHAFVWSLIAQHPSVRVGLLPDGQTTDIYVPPQPRVSRKRKGAQDDARESDPAVAILDPIPDYIRYSLEELTQLYGDRLRIAVDSETCFAAVTGSHAKPAKLTPMVYATLQIIARSRDSGISVLELGKATGYDQKTCFYIVKQLLELGLIVKLRRGGNSQNFCVHKYFFDRSLVWKSIRDEEYRALEESSGNSVVEDAAGGSGIESYQIPHFEPIDTRHLTSLSILSQRLSKLLKRSPGGIQPYANISVKIGFLPRSRTDRRFFIARLNELIKEGIIEKFFMTSMNPDTTHNTQLFLRLASSGRAQQIPADVDPEIADDDEMVDTLVTEDGSEQVQLKTTLTLHKQIIDLLQEFSSSGATLNDLSERLGSFDKKTLDLLISRMERQAPPPHLADSSVIQVLETYGRERRYRFFSLGGYSKLMEREGVERPLGSYSTDELYNAGGFMDDRKDEFYNGLDELQAFYKKCSGTRVHRFKDSTKVAVGRPPRVGASTGRQDDSTSPRTISKKKTNPILPDGTRKRGRPPKIRDSGEEPSPKRAKQSSGVKTIDSSCPVEDHAMDIEAISPAPAKRKRGRPPKKKPTNIVPLESVDATANAVAVQVSDYISVPTKKSSDAPLPESSTESVGHPQDNAGLGEDVTRVIASLAAQLNASFSSDVPSISTGELATVNPEAAALVSNAEQGHGKASEKSDRDASEANRPLDNQESMDVLSASLESLSNTATMTDDQKPVDDSQLSSTTPLRRPQRSGFQQGKTNLSAIRRENEFLQLIENSGGIINTSTNGFIDTYMNFIETSVKAGEMTSAPIGARTDRRTLKYTLDKLEEAGRIKSIITNLPSATGGYRKARVAYVSTLTEEAVRDWLSKQRTSEYVPAQEDGDSDSVSGTGLEVLERVKRQRRRDQEDKEKKEADMKLLLLHKKLETVKSREAAWQAIVDKVHPGLVKGVAASRLRKLRQSYVQGTVLQDNHHWETQVSDAIRAAEKMRSSRRLFPNVPKVTSKAVSTNQTERDLSRLPISAQGKSVEALLKLQENLLSNQQEPEDRDNRKGKRSASARKGGRVRRKRFQWNADYDELARDAYAILNARCRAHHRLEWSAVDQIFPSLPRGSVRARVSILKDQPGAEAYLQRLENCWYELWVKKRGTPELPDPHPRDPMDFNLKAHLQYLRKYVDKNAIRVGVSTLEESEFTPLPINPEDLISLWNLEERKAAYMNWDFLSQVSVGEETREKLLLEAALVLETDGLFDEEPLLDTELFAEAVLKMVIGTPDVSYSADEAAALLHKSGDGAISAAMDRLLSRNVLSKLVKDPTKAAPGRTLKISEINQNALGGPLAKDLFVDASQLDESYEMVKDEWREWALTSTDGDTAALLQRCSEHLVEFEVDTSHAQAARGAIDGNSRKVDDDDIELRLQVNLNEPSTPKDRATPVEDEPDTMEINDALGSGHGISVSGKQACCNIRTGGVVDCLKCIDEARSHLDEWSVGDRSTGEFIIQQIENKGKSGIGIEELKILANISEEAFTNVIHSLHALQVPLIYLIGYNSSTAVSAKYADAYAVTLPVEDGSALKIFPRRWSDTSGGPIQAVWEAGLRAVIGIVHLRPGISQAELRWRLRAVYDRQEILDLLNHLVSRGLLETFRNGEWQREGSICIHALSKEEEKAVYWKVREERRWYRIP